MYKKLNKADVSSAFRVAWLNGYSGSFNVIYDRVSEGKYNNSGLISEVPNIQRVLKY